MDPAATPGLNRCSPESCKFICDTNSPLLWGVVSPLIDALELFARFGIGRTPTAFPRGTVTGGPYGVVRHPAYAGECILVASCFFAAPGLAALLPFLALFPAIVLRIRAEEKVLDEVPAHREYARRVRWRLVPGVW